MAEKRPTALGFDIFAGGFTLGVKKHFDVIAVLEEGPYGVATMRRNQPEIPVYVGPDDWPMAELRRARGIGFIYGNPPCAAWSPAGHTPTKDWRKDDRVHCTRRHFSLLEELKPRVWVWESVPQAFTKGREFVDELTHRALAMGYSVTYLIHNAMWLGAPQNRKRFFMVCHDVEIDDVKMVWTSRACGEVLRKMNYVGEQTTSAKAMTRYADILTRVQPGETLRRAWDRENARRKQKIKPNGHIIGRPGFTIKRPRPDQPSGVVMNEMIHPTEDRFMTIQELAALCGFPPDYDWGENPSSMAEVSRGVCPPVGAWIAGIASRAIRANKRVRKPCVRLIDVSDPPGSVETIERTTTMTKTKTKVAAPRKGGNPKPEPGQGSGAFIRSLLVAGYETDEILELVHANYPGSKATKSDVGWNRNKLKKEGAAPARKKKPEPKFEVQPTRSKRTNVDVDREFDTTSLRKRGSSARTVHRDYAAHFFRWGFAGRFVNNEVSILDVGCGVDVAFTDILTHPRSNVPLRYVGVDYNKKPQRVPGYAWCETIWEFDFTKRYKELKGPFSLITCFEVIEHMRPADGAKLLDGIRWNLDPDGVALLSTPVFDGKAAANHIHEWTIPELADAIEAAGFVIEKRYGTFASWPAIKKVATAEQIQTATALSQYYSGEVISCFLAPLYPQASRNNVWMLKRNGKKVKK